MLICCYDGKRPRKGHCWAEKSRQDEKNRYYERCQSPKQFGDLSSDT